MIQRIKQFFMAHPAIRVILIVVCACLLLSACHWTPQKYDKDAWALSYENCFPCILYEALFKSLDELLVPLITTSCQLGLELLGIGLLFWIAFQALKLVSFREPDIKKFVIESLTLFGKAIIVSAMIFDPNIYIDFLGNYIVQPVFLFFSEISRTIMVSNTNIAAKLVAPGDIAGIASYEGFTYGKTIFGEAPLAILDIIYHIFAALYSGIAIGITMLTQPGLLSIIFALLIMLMFFLLVMVLPISFIDGFIQVASLIILSPFIWAAWVFPFGNEIVKRAWSVLLGALMNIMFACIYVSMTVYVLLVFSERTFPGIFGRARQSMDPTLEMELKTVSNRFISFFLLGVAIFLLSKKLPSLVKHYTGTATAMGGILKGFKKARDAAKFVGTTIATSGTSAAASTLASKVNSGKTKSAAAGATSNAVQQAMGGKGSGAFHTSGSKSSGGASSPGHAANPNPFKSSNKEKADALEETSMDFKALGKRTGDSIKKGGKNAADNIDKGTKNAANNIDKGGKAAAKSVDEGGKAAAKSIDQSGKAAAAAVGRSGRAAGQSVMSNGAQMCGMGYGLGALVGIPMILAGAAISAGATAAEAGIRAGSKIAAVGTRIGSKAASVGIRAGAKATSVGVEAGGKAASAGVKAGSNVAASATEGAANTAANVMQTRVIKIRQEGTTEEE